MQIKLDWYSFTFPIGQVGDGDGSYEVMQILLSFHDFTLHAFLDIVTARTWSFESSAGFYKYRIRCPKSGLCISWKPYNQYAQAELSGQVCDYVTARMAITDLMNASHGRCTRCDLATDFETDVLPADFVAMRGPSRITSNGHQNSPTGLTEYVGSRSSGRMARVYRYFGPHPRSHLLRVEVEYKGDAAKQLVAEISSSGLILATASANLPFAWMHPLWDIDRAAVSKIPARYYDRNGAGTLAWLNDSVAPALRKAHEKGLIDLAMWIYKHFDDILKD